jgi:DnaJ-class molecular chaperone
MKLGRTFSRRRHPLLEKTQECSECRGQPSAQSRNLVPELSERCEDAHGDGDDISVTR